MSIDLMGNHIKIFEEVLNNPYYSKQPSQFGKMAQIVEKSCYWL